MSTRSTRNNRNIRLTRPSASYSGRKTYGNMQASRNSGSRPGNPTSMPMTKKKSKVPRVLLAILLILILGGQIAEIRISPSHSACKEIIQRFQVACNDLNVNGMIGCLKPSMTNNLLKLGTAAAGDEALDAVLSLVGSGLDTIGIGSETTIEQLFQTIQLEPKRFGFLKRTRCVKCKATFVGMTQFVNIYVTKYYGDTYITKITFLK